MDAISFLNFDAAFMGSDLKNAHGLIFRSVFFSKFAEIYLKYVKSYYQKHLLPHFE